MAYVEAHADLKEHPKTKKAARLLSIPRVNMIGHLLCLWWWAQDYAQDGALAQYDTDDIAAAAEWEGDPDIFIAALLNCGTKNGAGFLIKDIDGALVINDWFQYGGKMFVKRSQGADRVRNWRAREHAKRSGNTDEPLRNAPVTRYEPLRNAPVTQSNADRSDQTRKDNIPPTPQVEAAKPNGHGTIDDFSLIEVAHGSFVGRKMTLDQTNAYLDWLKVTTPSAIIAALQAANANHAKSPFAYAMKTLENQKGEGKLPGNGPKVTDFSPPQEVEASWM